MLFCFGIFRQNGGMKQIFIAIISVLLVASYGVLCFATLHPVEGSDNYLETDDPPYSTDCADIQFVFARGSGAPHETSSEWTAYRDAMAGLAQKRNYTYVTKDLDYPAVSILDPISNALGAYVSAGYYYKFGQSV